MSAIVISPAPHEVSVAARDSADYMPPSTRIKVADEINRLWAEFVNEMHDGPTNGPYVAEKFWKFVTGT